MHVHDFSSSHFLSHLATPCADPEYMAFVEHLAKPTEYLPSAEVQLERREAEKAASLGTYLVVFLFVTNNAEGILSISEHLKMLLFTTCISYNMTFGAACWEGFSSPVLQEELGMPVQVFEEQLSLGLSALGQESWCLYILLWSQR